MWKSKVLIGLLTASFLISGCNIQTVQQYENEQKEQSEKVIVKNTNDEVKKEEKEEKKEEVVSETASNKMENEEIKKKPIEAKIIETPKDKETNIQKEATKKGNEEQPKTSVVKEKQPEVVVKQTPASPIVQTETPKKEAKKEEPAKAVKAEGKVTVKPVEHKKSEPVTENPKPAPKPVAPKPIEKKEKIEYVYVSIGMKVLLIKENYEKLPKALQNPKYVPNNGVIANQIKVKFEEGDMAWDAILQVRNKFGVNIAYKNNPMYGIYIEGINHVYEKNAGEMSGWMYAVNGKKAPVGVSNYALKPNDTIQLQYSLNQGTDLGW